MQVRAVMYCSALTHSFDQQSQERMAFTAVALMGEHTERSVCGFYQAAVTADQQQFDI